MECTSSFTVLLCEFRCVLTQPSFQISLSLMAGWLLSPRRRFVTELIWSSGSAHRGHHSRYYNFLSKSIWNLDHLSCVLTKPLVRTLVPSGIIEVTFENVQQGLGFEDPANRKEQAVRRTALMVLVLYDLVVLWFHREGHRDLQFPDRLWYPASVSLPSRTC